MKRYFDALVVVPLEEEFQLVVDAFSYVENVSSSTLIRFVVSPIGTKLNLLLVNQTKMGKQANIEAVLECLNEFNFGLLVCVGIAAGISSDVAIGDVCFSKLLVDVIDNIKVVGDKKKRTEIFLSPSFFDTPTELVISINLDRLEPGTKPAYELWLDQREAIAKGLLPNEFPGKDGKSEVVTRPKVRDGLIACGAVSASAGYNAKLRSIDRKILALETESGGMFSIARARNIPALAVRGISDYADADKNEFEAATGNNARRLAASNAASFLARQLKTVRLINYLDKRRLAHSESADQLSLLPHTEEGDILNVLLKQGESIYEKLRDQAPGFSLIAKGYRLPVPRIRTFHVRSGLPSAAGKESFEVRDALRDTRVITINLTPEYPDLSLAWIIAADLLTAQLDNKQMLPCVLEASNLHRPRTGIAELLDPYTSAIAREAAVQPVFIIDNFNFDSKTRIEFLTEQIEAWPEAKFIIVTRSRRNVILESDFSRTIASATAEVTDISFIEMATFVEKNFEMPGPAAEVVAVRLREIFQKYSLAAHPSYFAGIPRATLDAFAQANRRADLIELAVAGYLRADPGSWDLGAILAWSSVGA